MKKTINIWVIGLLALGLASCGGKKDAEKAEIVLSPETTHIKGDLGDYFEVVDVSTQLPMIGEIWFP